MQASIRTRQIRQTRHQNCPALDIFSVESSIFSSFVPGCCATGVKIPVPAKAEVTHGNSNRDQEALRTAESGL